MNTIPTKQDFDNAVKQEWSVDTCIIAQMHQRIFGEPMYGYLGNPRRKEFWLDNMLPAPRETLRVFDQYFRQPGDENKPELQQLRDSLP